MDDRIDALVSGLEHVTQSVRARFGGLSRDQLNWQPAAGNWSIAQCLDHLITINRLAFYVSGDTASPVMIPEAGAAPARAWQSLAPEIAAFARVLGGSFVRVFGAKYPDIVAGLVLIDPAPTASTIVLPGSVRRTACRSCGRPARACWAARRTAAAYGRRQLVGMTPPAAPTFSAARTTA